MQISGLRSVGLMPSALIMRQAPRSKSGSVVAFRRERDQVYPESVRIRCGVFTPPVGWDSLIGMSGAILTAEDRAHLLRMMRRQTPSPVHRRMNALLLLDDGWTAEQVAKVLFIDAETVREPHRLYQASGVTGIERLKYQGAACDLSEEQRAALGEELDARLY